MSEVKDLVTHFIMTCDDKFSIAVAKYVTYSEGLRATVTFI